MYSQKFYDSLNDVVNGQNNEVLTFKTNLEQLLFKDFITCTVDSDYNSIVISGDPTTEQIHDAWVVLVSQYQALTQGAEHEEYIHTSARIEALNAKINIVSALVEAVRISGSELLIAELKNTWGYRYKYTEQTLEKDLQSITNKIANDHTRLSIEIAGKKEENEEDQPKATKETFMKLILRIEEKRKVSIDLDSLNTYMFCLMLADYKEYNDLMAAKYSGNGTK